MLKLIASTIVGALALFDLAAQPDGRDSAPKASLDARGYVRGVGFSSDGAVAFTTGGMLTLWDVKTGIYIRSITPDAVGMASPVLTPDGKRLIAAGGSQDKYVRVWNVETGKVETKIAVHENGVKRLALRNDGQMLAAIPDQANVIHLIDLKAKKTIAVLKGDAESERNWASDVAFSPDGKFLASACDGDRTTIIWDVAKRKPVHTLRAGRTWLPKLVAWSRDGKILATASAECEILLWDARSGDFITQFRAKLSSVQGIAFSPKEELLAIVGGLTNTLLFWRMETKEFTALRGHTKTINCLAFSPDGKLLITGSDDKTAKIWEVPSK